MEPSAQAQEAGKPGLVALANKTEPDRWETGTGRGSIGHRCVSPAQQTRRIKFGISRCTYLAFLPSVILSCPCLDLPQFSRHEMAYEPLRGQRHTNFSVPLGGRKSSESPLTHNVTAATPGAFEEVLMHGDDDLPATYLGPEMRRASVLVRQRISQLEPPRETQKPKGNLLDWLPEVAWVVLSVICIIGAQVPSCIAGQIANCPSDCRCSTEIRRAAAAAVGGRVESQRIAGLLCFYCAVCSHHPRPREPRSASVAAILGEPPAAQRVRCHRPGCEGFLRSVSLAISAQWGVRTRCG